VDHLPILPPFRLAEPTGDLRLPLIVASPHSGRDYPAAFVEAARQNAETLRRSEDFMVDELFADAPGAGARLLAATFPRSFCDVNREPWELDPTMFADSLPAWCNTHSAKVKAGFGTIARLISAGLPIYRHKLTFDEARARIAAYWHPYHDALATHIELTRITHGACITIDAHSMPSPSGARMPDIVLGDAFGTSCAPDITAAAHHYFTSQGLRVHRNIPYSGGYVTRHYGRPRTGSHVLQVEINRALYMDENRLAPNQNFLPIRAMMARFVHRIGQVSLTLPPK